MKGMNEDEGVNSFIRHARWQKLIVISGGFLANTITAWLLLYTAVESLFLVQVGAISSLMALINILPFMSDGKQLCKLK